MDNKNNKKAPEVFTTGIVVDKEKKRDKIDILCYVGMAVLFVFIFIPPVLRLFVEEEPKQKTEQIVYTDVKCVKREAVNKAMLYKNIDAKYKNGSVQNIVIDFSIVPNSASDSNMDIESIEIPQVNKLLGVNHDGFKLEKNSKSYVFKADYANYDLSKVPELADYSYVAAVQITKFTNEGYSCQSTSRTEEIIIK